MECIITYNGIEFTLDEFANYIKNNALEFTSQNIEIHDEDYSAVRVDGINHLITTKISNFNAGIQLNAWHETEDSSVTAPTQMLNGAIFRSFSLDDIYQVYEAVGDLVDKELTYIFDEESGIPGKRSIPDLVKGLSNAEFYAQNKDLILRVFKGILEDKVSRDDEFSIESLILESFSHEDLPIDDPHLFNAGIAELSSHFTKKGIKLDFDGMFAVLTPAARMVQLIDVKGGHIPVKGDNLTIKYKALPVNTVTSLTLDQFKKWNAVNESGLFEKGEVLGQPRDLKGQQLQVTYSDGSVEALSVLRTDDEHLLEEANNLSLIKGFANTFVSSFEAQYNSLATAEEKLEFQKQAIVKFDSDLRSFILSSDRLKGLYDLVVSNFNRVNSETETPFNLVSEYIYYLMSNDYDFRTEGYKNISLTKDQMVSMRKFEIHDIANSVSKLYLGALQKRLADIQEGNIPEYLLERASTLNKQITGISVTRAEVLAPITAKKNFMLREGDDFSEIDYDFFLNRLNEGLDIYNVDADSVVVIDNNLKLFFKEGRPPKNAKPVNNIRNVDGKLYFVSGSGSRLFQIPKGSKVVNDKGNIFIYSNDPATPNNIIRNVRKLKDVGGNITTYELGSNVNDRLLKRESAVLANETKAQQMYTSWKRYLNLIGTRIPGQHYQSFQGLKIVGFSEGNRIHVPDEVTLLSGSDFDIDKQNIIFYSVSNGLIQLWHPAGSHNSDEELELSLQLPLMKGRELDYFVATKTSRGTYIQNIITDYADEELGLEDLVRVYKLLEKGYKFDYDRNPRIVEQLYGYEGFILSDEANIKAIKNFSISKINSAIENKKNFTLLSNPVSMDLVGSYASDSSKGRLVQGLRVQNPKYIPAQKEANMVGKDVIGITASSGLKAFSAYTLFSNKLVEDNAYNYELRKSWYRDAESIISPILSQSDLPSGFSLELFIESLIGILSEGNKNSLSGFAESIIKQISTEDTEYLRNSANIYVTLKREVIENNWDIANLNLSSSEYGEVKLKEYYAYRKNSKYINKTDNDLLTLVNLGETDAADLKSQILSAATDNAKELILNKINATPELVPFYLLDIMRGKSFESVYFYLTSDFMETIIKKARKNIYDTVTKDNSMLGLISLAETASTKDKDGNLINKKAIESLEEKYRLRLTTQEGSDVIVFTDIDSNLMIRMNELSDLKNRLTQVQSLTLLGRYLGINQGVKSNDWDLYSFTKGLEDYMVNLNVSFNMKEFLDSVANNDMYHRNINRIVDGLEENAPPFNITRILTSNPHFIKQLTAYNVANTILRESSYKVNSAYAITDGLKEIGFLTPSRSLTKEQFRETIRFIENTVLSNFIHNEPKMPKFFTKEGNVMTLESNKDREAFIDWVNTEFVPHIQDSFEMPELKGNDFVKSIVPNNRPDVLSNTPFEFVELLMDTTNVKSITQSQYRDSYSHNLNTIFKNGYRDRLNEDENKRNNIFEVLFWYNLAVNKNNISKNSYAKFLGEIMLTTSGNNAYKRLLSYEGKIGKNTESRRTSDTKVMSNGVEFDLVDLLKSYEMTPVDIKYTDNDQTSDYDRYLENPEDITENWNDDVDSIIESNLDDNPDSQNSSNLDDNLDDLIGDLDEDSRTEDDIKLTVKKERTFRGVEKGTYVKITQKKGKEETILFDGVVDNKSSILMDSSTSRNRTSTFNNFIQRDTREDRSDIKNYNSMLTMSMHELLSSLVGAEVEIIRYDNGKEVIEIFDPNKDYDCL